MALQSPLDSIVTTVQLTDHELRQVMSDASKEADRIIRSLGDDLSTGARLRSAQVALAKVNADMWASVGDATRVGVGDAFDAATDWQSRYDEAMMNTIGVRNAYWRQSMLASARQGLPNYLARKQNGYTLSQRVYANKSLSSGAIDRTINNALLLGKSPSELATDVKKYISPSVPGGASYAAMRLGRTEVVNAYHTNAVNRYQATPWIERVKWNLSGSHPKPDTCNEYAEGGDVPRAAGVWFADNVPDKPHPQCLCYVTPVTMDLDKFAKNFQAGQYDHYIDHTLGCERIA